MVGQHMETLQQLHSYVILSTRKFRGCNSLPKQSHNLQESHPVPAQALLTLHGECTLMCSKDFSAQMARATNLTYVLPSYWAGMPPPSSHTLLSVSQRHVLYNQCTIIGDVSLVVMWELVGLSLSGYLHSTHMAVRVSVFCLGELSLYFQCVRTVCLSVGVQTTYL